MLRTIWMAVLAAALLGAPGALAQPNWGGKTPPPLLKQPSGGAPAGSVAPDGVGVTVNNAPFAGEMTADNMTYLAWEDAAAVKPLAVGSPIPQGSVVRAASGAPFSLNDAAKAKPTVLIFYRGGWCPFCNAHLSDLQEAQPELEKLGYQILAVSTDTPEEIQKFNEKNKLSYTLLSDTKLEVSSRFGLRYKVTKTYVDHVKEGREVNLADKTDGYMLAPGAFVLDRKGVVQFAYVNMNYTVRVGQEKLLEAARAALKK